MKLTRHLAVIILTLFGSSLAIGRDRPESPSSYTLEDVISLGAPVINITTVEDRFPEYEIIDAPEGCIGCTVINAEKLPGRIDRIEPDGTISYTTGDYINGESGMTIRIRGNGSATRFKKSFKIKLQKKGDLLVRDDPDKRDKNWVLMMDRDRKHITGLFVNKLLELQWTPSWEFVNVVYNGKYHGYYLLIEAVDRNQKCKLNVSNTGFIVEHDPSWFKKPDECFTSSLNGPRYAYTFKWPDYEDMDAPRIEYIKRTIGEYEASVTKDYYPELIDVDALSRWVLGHDILGTLDTGGANRFMTKYDDTPSTKIIMGNMWDFDSSEGLGDVLTIFHTYFFKEMFENQKNQALLCSYIDAYDRFGEKIFKSLEKRFEDELANGDDIYDTCMESDHRRWQWDVQTDIKFTAQRQLDYFSHRRNVIKQEVDKLRATVNSSVSEISDNEIQITLNGLELSVSGLTDDISIYSIDGCQVARRNGTLSVSLPGKGMYIIVCGGKQKKIIV